MEDTKRLHSFYTCRDDDPNLAQMAAVGALPAPDNNEADQGGADHQGLDMDDMVAVGALPAPDQIAAAQVALLQPPQVQRRVGSPTPPVSGRATPSTPPPRPNTPPSGRITPSTPPPRVATPPPSGRVTPSTPPPRRGSSAGK